MSKRGRLTVESVMLKTGAVGKARLAKALLEHGGGGRDKSAGDTKSSVPVGETTSPLRQSKYRSTATEGPLPCGVGVRKYASKREAAFASKLEIARKAGQIAFWLPQVRFPLDAPSGQKCRAYVADFVTFQGGCMVMAKLREAVGAEPKELFSVVVYDTKGFRTDEYKRKKKAMKAVYGIEIVEV